MKLLTAFGNANLILELIDFFNGGSRFQYNEQGEEIRRSFDGRRIGDLHLVCTSGQKDKFSGLTNKIVQEYPKLKGHIHAIDLACDDIACQGDDEDARKTIYDQVRNLAGRDLVISSGGRKLITQRLIEAGLLYGCKGYLTITAPSGAEKDPKVRFRTREFNVVWTRASKFYREKRDRLIRDEIGDTFRSLYLLPVSLVTRLQDEKIGIDPARAEEEKKWLRHLPKTDLHCHLGGSYDFHLLKELAVILLEDLKVPGARQAEIAAALEKRLDCPLPEITPESLMKFAEGKAHCLKGLKDLCHDLDSDDHVCHAVLVSRLPVGKMKELAEDRPLTSSGTGDDLLDWYMASGDLGGSALLQTEGTLRRAVAWLVEYMACDGVRYLEVRFSPGNYTRAGLGIHRVMEIVTDEAERRCENRNITVNFLVMATRHKDEEEMKRHVDAATKAWKHRNGRKSQVVGFDLAGQEKDYNPENFKEIFQPLHDKFMNITIHAGEMAEEKKIRQALYELHAKRIGHGLKLIDNRAMMNYVRDWGIAIEMCPSSNRQTNGFRLNDEDNGRPEYPLKEYLKHGIQVTVNTDNPGISNTRPSQELWMAARLTPDGLSRWDILRLVRNGFKAVFLPRDKKDELLKEVDQQIFELLLKERVE